MTDTDFHTSARAIAGKHLEVHGHYDHYTGIVTLHGLARLATESGTPEDLAHAKAVLAPYIAGERKWGGNFPNYYCGGNATAWMLHRGHAPEAADTVRGYADQILREAPKDQEGILEMPRGDPGRIWIDVAFAVTPFLVFAGLALEEPAYVEEGFQQTAKMIGVLRNPDTGLLHQSRGFNGPNRLSEDHWSRGNGWAAYALCELASELPADHPRKQEAVRIYRDLLAACLRHQDPEGLWRQEMTGFDTPRRAYTETSGSALMLYAIGRGLKAGIADPEWETALIRGLAGLENYLTAGHDIFHTCTGCLCPGEGGKRDYMAVPPVKNDPHAFGPYVLAFGQASALGLSTPGDA